MLYAVQHDLLYSRTDHAGDRNGDRQDDRNGGDLFASHHRSSTANSLASEAACFLRSILCIFCSFYRMAGMSSIW